MEILLERQRRELNILRQKRHQQRAHTAVPLGTLITDENGTINKNATSVTSFMDTTTIPTAYADYHFLNGNKAIVDSNISKSSDRTNFYVKNFNVLQKANSMKLASDHLPKSAFLTQNLYNNTNSKLFSK